MNGTGWASCTFRLILRQMPKANFHLFETFLLHGVLVGLDHLLDHLTAYGAGLLRGEVTVVTLLEVYTNFVCSFHLKSLHCFLCFRNQSFIACHCFDSPILNGLPACKAVHFHTHLKPLIKACNKALVSRQPFCYLYDRARIACGSVTIVRLHSLFMSGKNFIFRAFFSNFSCDYHFNLFGLQKGFISIEKYVLKAQFFHIDIHTFFHTTMALIDLSVFQNVKMLVK